MRFVAPNPARAALGLILLVAGAAAPSSADAPRSAATRVEEIADFAGGCFWCLETQFEGVPGVLSVVSGYTGGKKLDPTYDEVSHGGTGHYESIQIRFDPRRISYDRLLDRFWHSIDPTQADGQFCDRGDQYRSAIFTHSAQQRRQALESKRRIERSGILRKPIVTQILPSAKFYPAEEYHQDFWKKDPDRYQSYRRGCGRDRRVEQIWGKLAAHPSVH